MDKSTEGANIKCIQSRTECHRINENWTFWIADPIRSDLLIYKVVLLGGIIFLLLFLGLLIFKKRGK
jgi:hypothetical protein